ncbi:MAG: cytochrome c biogenesis protein CcsA [Gemmatimonadota bacterium]
MSLGRVAKLGAGTGLLGVVGVLVTHWLVFFWVPTDAFQGVIQRIFYIHVPAAWITEMAFALTALCSVVYLWLGDDRADAAGRVLVEAGLYFGALLLIVGPLWGRVAWGAYWTWEPRLTLTLLLWFIFLGYQMVRRATENPERGKRLAAVVAIVGALDIPLIHMSVYWFRSLHPQPVVMRPSGPTADPEMVTTLMVALLSYTLVFFGVVTVRYVLERTERRLEAWVAVEAAAT